MKIGGEVVVTKSNLRNGSFRLTLEWCLNLKQHYTNIHKFNKVLERIQKITARTENKALPM